MEAEELNEDSQTERKRGPLLYLGLAGLAGITLLVGGCAAGIVAYDEKYFPDEGSGPSQLWDVVSGVGVLAVVAGLLLIVISIIGAVVVGIGRAAREAQEARRSGRDRLPR